MSKDWEANPERFKRQLFLAWSLEAIQFFYEQRGIVANGHESMDTDAIRNLAAASWSLANRGPGQPRPGPRNRALIVVAWPKAKDGLGIPARAFAILP